MSEMEEKMEQLKKLMNQVIEHGKAVHSPEVWDKIPEKEKNEIIKREKLVNELIKKYMFTNVDA